MPDLDWKHWVLIILVLFFGLWILGFLNFPLWFGDDDENDTTTTTVEAVDDCTQYHLYDEFVDEFGRELIGESELRCEGDFPTEGLDGRYFEREDIIGCLWNPALPDMDCHSDELEAAEDYCEDDLLAVWVCDNSISFVGCICQFEEPVWTPPDDIDPNDYCQLRGEPGALFCGGDCEDGMECIRWIPNILAEPSETYCYCEDIPNHV